MIKNSFNQTKSNLFQLFSKIEEISLTCCSVSTKGGVIFKMCLLAGFEITPFSKSFFDKEFAKVSLWNSIAMKSPTPLISLTCLPFLPLELKICLKLLRSKLPIFSAFCDNFSSMTTSIAAMAVLEASGLPPNVEPCSPGWIWFMTSLVPKTAETGMNPPLKLLPKQTMSGLTPSCSKPNMVPVLPKPDCTSSQMNKTLYFLHKRSTSFR